MRWAPLTSRIIGLTALAGDRLADALFPVSCVFCGERQPEKITVCPGCHGDLPWATARQPQITPLAKVMAPLEYAFPVDAAIKAMKFKRKLFYAPAFANLLRPFLEQMPDDIDALLPMPLHWLRHATRGFNQSAEISRGLAKITGLPIVRNVVRRRNTPYQSGLTAAQRKRNLKGAFVVKVELNYRHIVIVDDVITTGETCRQLAKAVLAAGTEKVSVIAVARTPI